MAFKIIQIPHDDDSVRHYAERYKAFRLLSLQTAPEAFLSTYARESAFTDEVWHSRLSNPEATTFIAVQLDRVVSTITILGPLPYSPEEQSPLGNPWVSLNVDITVNAPTHSHWRINGMFTLPDARGLGIAKALIEEAKKFGSDQAATAGKDLVLSIAVEEDNVAAKSLYEKCGFVSITEVANPSDSGNILLMKYTPNSS